MADDIKILKKVSSTAETGELHSSGVDYTKNLLLAIKRNEETSDFTIKVGAREFKVHQAILMEASDYFRAMISTNMKEGLTCVTEMKDIHPNIMEKCITFMYIGEIGLLMSEIKDILHASDMMLLHKLVEICFNYLWANLSAYNCLESIYLSKLYHQDDFQKIFERFVCRNFQAVMSPLRCPTVEKKDFIEYLEATSADYHNKWRAVIMWFHKKDDETKRLFPEFLNHIKLKTFPLKFLLQTAMKEDLVKNDKLATHMIISRLFSDLEFMVKQISPGLFLQLKKELNSTGISYSESMQTVMNTFMEKNFEELVHKDDFVLLQEKEILYLFQSMHITYSSEKVKWEAALKWTKFSNLRIDGFPELFKSINFERMSSDFLHQTVHEEHLVLTSPECTNHLLSFLFNVKSEPSSYLGIAIVYTDQDHKGLYKGPSTIKIYDLRRKAISHIISPNNTRPWSLLNVNSNLYLIDHQHVYKKKKDNTWVKESNSQIKEKDGYFQCVALSHKIYIVKADSTCFYDTTQRTWNTTDTNGCKLGDGFCVTVTENTIWAFGGKGTYSSTKVFNETEHQWCELTRMHTGRQYAAAAVLEGKVYVIGGQNEGGKSLDSVECYKLDDKSWTSVSKLQYPRKQHTAIAIRNKLYIIGGYGSWVFKSNYWADTVEVYDSDTNKWTNLADISIAPPPDCSDIVLSCPYFISL